MGVNCGEGAVVRHGLPLLGVNHLEGHVYANWLVDPGEAVAGPVPAVVADRLGRPHDLVLMRDHGRRTAAWARTLDDAAGEAFDKVGRLLGLGYPGGPAIERAAESGHGRVDGLPARLACPARTTSASRGSRRPPGGSLRPPVRTPVSSTTPGQPLPEAVVAELSWGFQDSVTDVLTTKTIRAAREVGARSIVLGGGVAANSALRARLRARRRPWACR